MQKSAYDYHQNVRAQTHGAAEGEDDEVHAPNRESGGRSDLAAGIGMEAGADEVPGGWTQSDFELKVRQRVA